MRERINRLAKGIIDNTVPRLQIEPERIDRNVRTGEMTRGELNITNEEGLHMKGLVYSFNIRVKVLNETFGGLRNRIGYEVDSSHLNQGDKIEGSFLLVTNGGEREIPFCFQVELGASGKTLESLKTKEDFGEIAKKDMEQALLLFEYQDFINAPFMQELRTRTIYEGIRGRGSRMNQLEEFLIALKIKESIEISVETGERFYSNPSGSIEDTIVIRRHTWGYVNIELRSDGDFIELAKHNYTDKDFTDDICTVSYRIEPKALHHGKNLGAVTISTIRTSAVIRVEVQRDRGRIKGREAGSSPDLSAYIDLRLDYESALYEERLLLSQMVKELERLRRQDGKNSLTALLLAETWIYQGDKERSGVLLGEVKDQVLAVRQEQVFQYCFYQYLVYLVQRKDGQREALTRLLRKYLSENDRRDYLFVLLLKIEPSMAENPGDLLARMRHIHREGSSSPFLYLEAWKLFKRNPELLKKMDSFELQVLTFAVRRQMIEKPLAAQAAKLAASAKYYHRLFYRLMVKLYHLFPEKEMLEAICSLLIKGDVRSQREFHWFKKALKAGINLTRLYEYFLYTLPRTYTRLLPKEVLLYFSYAKDIDRHSKSILYMNILKYMKPEAALYRQYERDMEQFAMEQLFESRINSRLAVIYKRFIYKDLIDVPVAKVLPSILRSFRVSCSNPAMKYVVVCYEELTGEDAFLLEDGIAYIPLYSDHNILLFQDAYGNRYMSYAASEGDYPTAGIAYDKTPAMEGDVSELEERCFDVYPSHPMLRLQECREILDAGIAGEAELDTLEGILADLPMHPLFRQHLLSGMIDYLLKESEQQEEAVSIDNSFLGGLLPSALSEKECGRISEILILQGRISEAYDMIRQYGYEKVKSSRLMKLCTKMILQNLFDEDETLLELTYHTFVLGRYDSIILDYLCEHFNGKTDQMYEILKQGIAERIETYDMEERLLAQMLFTGETKNLDTVFELYVSRKKTRENIIKAYFTVKSAEYFIGGKTVSDKVFGYLEQAVLGIPEKDKMPAIYLLALTKYYSGKDMLTTEQQNLCESMTRILLEEEMIFPYFKELGRHVPIPEELLTSIMVEYHASYSGQPEIEIRILPQEEQFHLEEMKKVFPDMYVKFKRLFDGEVMEYRIYEMDGEQRICKQEGSLSAEKSSAATSDRRFLALNEMCISLKHKDEDLLKKTMAEYIVSAFLVEELFQLM